LTKGGLERKRRQRVFLLCGSGRGLSR
jgi:hypothetical protein